MNDCSIRGVVEILPREYVDVAPPQSLLNIVGKGEASIGEVLAARAERSPDEPFLKWLGKVTAYRDAFNMVRKVGAGLVARSGTPRPRVLSFLDNEPAAIWTWLGAAFAGGTYIPINRSHRGTLLAEMVARAQADLIVTDAPGLHIIGEAGREVPMLLVSDLANEAPDGLPPRKVLPTDVACIMFTSGTTGQSKAVQIPHGQYTRGAARLVDAFGLVDRDVFHNWLPLYHLGGQLHMTMSALICGGSVALFPSFSRSQFWDQVRSTQSSVLCGFSAILHMIWSLPEGADDADSSLRVGIFAGIPDDLRVPFERRFGMWLGDNYGMTEADPVTLPGRTAPPGSAGVAGGDFEVAIGDRQGRLLPPDQPGEILVRPKVPGVMMCGYENDHDATRSAMRNGWFHTGDLGSMDENGYLYFRGRCANYIRRRGENISAAEVEAIFLRHPEIDECAAVGVPSPLGEEDVKLVAVLKGGATSSAADLYDFAVASMAKFMVPRYVELVDGLPKTELGKVKLSALRDLKPGLFDAEALPGGNRHAR